MIVHRSVNHLPQFKNAVITIGTFDGVHLGHRQIINQLKKEAEAINGETVIITFHPHPRTVVAGGKEIFLLNTLDEKITLLDELGVDHLVVVRFDESFSNQTPEEYISNFLFDKFHPHTIIIGYDHRFGKERKGDYHLLEDYSKQFGFIVKEIPEQVINEAIVSSTRIRKALLETNIESANANLGYEYFFEGMVVDGNKLGRTLGYPTANVAIHDGMKLVPANGIYVAQAEIVEKAEVRSQGSEEKKISKRLNGMLSIGVRPTVDGINRTIEMNIFDFSEDIYGKILKVYLHKYLRAEVKFDNLEQLQDQMSKDRENSLAFFKKLLH